MNNLQLFKKISDNSRNLIKTFKPVEIISKFQSKNNLEIVSNKFQTTRRYTLALHLDREIQLGIKQSEKLTSNSINNEIILSNYKYNESKDELFLHKKAGDYYVIIQFCKVKPLIDKRIHDEFKNDLIEKYRKTIYRNSYSLYRIMGTENNPQYQKDCT
jgi:hypothetical protein